MNYSIFWAKHINKVEPYELGVQVIFSDTTRVKLKKEVVSAVGETISNAIDRGLVKSKGMPHLEGVEVTTVRDESKLGGAYALSCVVKVVGNRGWRNWFPLPLELRREYFKAIDGVVAELRLSVQKAIEPLCKAV